MKHFKQLFTALLLLCATVATAHDFSVSGIYYNITDATNKTVEVTYRGTSYSEYSNEYTGSVVIPESITYNGTIYSATSIGSEAFYDCSGLTSITIPNSLTSIGNGAFNGCTSLKELRIEDGEGTLSLGYNTYNNSYSTGKGLFYDCPLETLYLGRNLSYNTDFYYGYSPFYNIKTLANVTIGNSVTSIPSYAFVLCTGLTSIEIPSSVTSIGNNAFHYCTGLTSITIPNSVTSIGNNAFHYCTGLTSITIPNSVTSIGSSAFEYCTGLKEVHISDLAAWCNISFGSSNANPLYYAKNLYLNNELITELTIPNSVTSIGESAFSWCSGLTSITIPNSVTSIGYDAFYGCTGLTSITIPNSVTSIGYDAFYGCTGLKTVYNFSNLTFSKGSNNNGYIAYYATKVINAPNAVIDGDFIWCKLNGANTLACYIGEVAELTLPADYNGENYVIGNDAFNGCTGLASITIPNSVTSIGDYAFNGCTGFTSITIPSSVTSIGDYAFNGCDGLRTVYNFSNLTFSKGSSYDGFVAYYADKVYNAPNGSIEGDFIFGKPNDVNTLLYYLGNDTELTLPAGYNGENYAIGAAVFQNYTGLAAELIIHNNITGIGASAFKGCNNIEKLYIGCSVESIGDKAFAGCEKITEIKVALEKPIRGSADIFTNAVYDNATLYIPNGTEQLYQKREPWNLFFYIAEMDFTRIDEVFDEVKAESGKVKTVYDLNGRVVENPSKGIYIINGKKCWLSESGD